jgi:hypothetical protein
MNPRTKHTDHSSTIANHQIGWLLATLVAATWPAGAADAPAKAETSSAPAAEKAEAKPDKGPPLPLHQIEGNGGIFSTLSAYLVNPPRNGELLGRPAIGAAYVHLDHGRNLESLTLTETPWKRLELGYGYNRFDLGDLPQDIERATTIRLSRDAVTQHNFNARLQFLKENEFETKWVPALTLGTHYKYNEDIQKINDDLFDTLKNAGIKHHDGVDFTLYASKLLTFLPRPLLVNVGGRATEGAQLGLLGYTGNYSFVFEGSLVLFLTDSLALAAEYKQKPNDYTTVGNLVGKEDDWWTIDAAYVINKHWTAAVGYGHFGQVLNHEANGVWGITTKYEF